MKLPEILEERTQDARLQTPDLPAERLARLPDPRRAALLSLFPGLGQLYNGEQGKGLLFVAVSISNLILLSMLFCTEPVLKGFTGLAGLFNFQSSLDVQYAANVVRQGQLAVFLYAGLMALYMSYAARDAYDHALLRRRGKVYSRYLLNMPEATSGSYLAHFAGLITLTLLIVLYVTPPPSKEQVTNIELVQEEPKPKPKEPEKPKAEPPKPKVEQPKVEKTVVKPPPKQIPVAVAVPTNEPSPIVQSDEPAPAAAPVQTGSPGGEGSGQPGGEGDGDGEDMDFSSYLAEVQKRVKKTWFPPRGNESKSVTVKFKIKRDGSLGVIKLVNSSGVAVVDDAARTAVKSAAPYPPLPAGSPEEIDIKFTFDYNVFNGKNSAAEG